MYVHDSYAGPRAAGAERHKPPRTQGPQAATPSPASGGTSARSQHRTSRRHRYSCPMTGGHPQPDHDSGCRYWRRRGPVEPAQFLFSLLTIAVLPSSGFLMFRRKR